jgi:serine/threonine protein kinase/formylglycine-generating enzyme required for sulfatase activity/dienelactone hydrolase
VRLRLRLPVARRIPGRKQAGASAAHREFAMNQELWRRAEALFHAARERSPEARPAYVDEACGGDVELRREVLRLLSKEAQAASFLEGPCRECRGEVDALPAVDADDDARPVGQTALRARPLLETGRRIGPYEIQSAIGSGGMGEVYKARDTRLDRAVAIKVLLPHLAEDPHPTSKTPWRARFDREAKAIAGLNHPNVCALHDMGDEEGLTYLVMEFIDGQTLADRLQRGPLPMDEALRCAVEMAEALAAAHRQGIIHRDIKPANVMMTADGQVKVLDFGLAKHVGARFDAEGSAPAPTDPPADSDLTGGGAVLGTVSYLSPEQVQGLPLDARSDVFSFGAVLYELLTGRRAFPWRGPLRTMAAVLRDTPVPARRLRGDVPIALDAIVTRCLEKNRDRRYPSGVELHEALADCAAQLAARPGRGRLLRGRRLAVSALAVVAVSLAAVAWPLWQSSRVNWARTIALPEIARLIDEGRNAAAFRLVRHAERYLPNDPEIARLRRNHTRRASFQSDPPGADVYVRDYIDTAADAQWDNLGRTPLEAVPIPAGHLAFRISKPGYTTAEGYTASAVTSGVGSLNVKLDSDGTAPRGMVRVRGRTPIGEFWLDKYEVSNARYKAFVDRGGYRKAEYWKEPFVEGGRVIGWERIVARLTDATGRPGPAAWQLGAFPRGQDDYPVDGVSWYEAAAYCASEGKALPTVHHWQMAAHQGMFTTILATSNFGGRGPARVGSHAGIGPFGTYDAAGNVREWCLNASGANRCILGGAWNDPLYLFQLTDARLPSDRSSGNGFRCAKYEQDPPRELTGPVDTSLVAAGHSADRPASDEIYEIYKALHAYDHGELDARVEAIDDGSPFWRQEKVSFRAAYGNERVTAYLFLPKQAVHPLQVVVTFPGTYALDLRSSARLESQWFDFFVQSGRAVVHPIFKGMYERTTGGDYASSVSKPNVWRELAIQWHKDLGRTLDYLETRADVDRDKLAYHGLSLGTALAPRLLALEPRLKVAVLFWGGLHHRAAAEINPLHYAPRSTVPTLMVSGRFDPLFPESTSQLPMFRLLGTPDTDKRRVVVEGGHVAFNHKVVQEALAWLDKYLGPVRTR